MEQGLKKVGSLFALAAGFAVEAVGLTWTGAVDSDLLTAGNWNPAQVPAAENLFPVDGIAQFTRQPRWQFVSLPAEKGLPAGLRAASEKTLQPIWAVETSAPLAFGVKKGDLVALTVMARGVAATGRPLDVVPSELSGGKLSFVARTDIDPANATYLYELTCAR